VDDEILAAMLDPNTRGVLFMGPPKGKNDTNPTWIHWIGGTLAGLSVLVVRYSRDNKTFTKEWHDR